MSADLVSSRSPLPGLQMLSLLSYGGTRHGGSTLATSSKPVLPKAHHQKQSHWVSGFNYEFGGEIQAFTS